MPPVTPMFQFALWPVEEVAPWQDADGKPFLHWFGLTDGWYAINVGGVELLRYSQRLIDATPAWQWRTPYFDYTVARLHDDLLDVFSYAIEPVPSDLLDYVRTPYLEREFEERCLDAEDDWPVERPGSFWGCAAEWWFRLRGLEYGHMRGQPEIQLWTEDDTLHIRWRSLGEIEPETGLPWSEVEDGSCTMPRSRFIDEVRSFHQRLVNEMAMRVELAQTAWPLPDVHINLDELTMRQAQAEQAFDDALAHAGQTDWDHIRDLINDHLR